MKRLPVHIAVLVLAVLAVAAFAPTADASCRSTPESGGWVNVDPDSKAITRLAISRLCRDVIIDDEYASWGPNWYVELTGDCGTKQCIWGRFGAEQSRSHYRPRLDRRSSDDEKAVRIYPVFVSFERWDMRYYLYIHMSPDRDGTLLLRVYSEGWEQREVEDLVFRRDGP